MKVKWITHACIQLETDIGKIIYFDPYQLSGDLKKGDIILCSHDHFDHLSVNDIKQVATSKTKVIIPKSCSLDEEFDVIKLDIGESTQIDDIKIKAVPSYTIKLETHPKSNRWLGFIVTVDGKNIYHAGDTGKIEEMADFNNIDIAFVPVGGKYTMDFEEAAESIKLINPKIAIPIHNWEKPLEPFKKIVEKQIPNVKVELLSNKTLEI